MHLKLNSHNIFMVLITVAVLLLMSILLIELIPRSKSIDISDTTAMISTEIVNNDENDQSTKSKFTTEVTTMKVSITTDRFHSISNSTYVSTRSVSIFQRLSTNSIDEKQASMSESTLPMEKDLITTDSLTVNPTTMSHEYRQNMTSIVMNNQIGTSTVYQPSYWTSDSSLIRRRYQHSVVMFRNGKILATGGRLNSSVVTSTTEFYSSSGVWISGPSMRDFRYQHTLTLFANNTKALAIGSALSTSRQSAEVYNSETNTWTSTLRNMSNGRYAHISSLLENEQILLAGGRSGGGVSISAAEIYIPSSNSFINTNPMNFPRAYFAGTVLSDKSTVFVTGGTITESDTTATAELYREGSWILTSGEMTEARAAHAAVLLNDGTVLIAGGGYSSSSYVSSAEIYNFTSDTFTAVGSMKYRRGALTLTLLPSGKVLATGGYDQITKTYPVVSELYDPITRSWSDTHILNNGRNNHATILLNDLVLTIAGTNTGNNGLISCEKYDL